MVFDSSKKQEILPKLIDVLSMKKHFLVTIYSQVPL